MYVKWQNIEQARWIFWLVGNLKLAHQKSPEIDQIWSMKSNIHEANKVHEVQHPLSHT